MARSNGRYTPRSRRCSPRWEWEPAVDIVLLAPGEACPICEAHGITVTHEDILQKAKTPTSHGERSLGPLIVSTDQEPYGTDPSV